MKKPPSPTKINIVTIIIGFIAILVGITIAIFKKDADVVIALVFGIGTAFFSTGIINFLWMKQVSNKILKIVSDATLESWWK